MVKNDEKWDGELNHISVFVWAMFGFPRVLFFFWTFYVVFGVLLRRLSTGQPLPPQF